MRVRVLGCPLPLLRKVLPAARLTVPVVIDRSGVPWHCAPASRRVCLCQEHLLAPTTTARRHRALRAIRANSPIGLTRLGRQLGSTASERRRRQSPPGSGTARSRRSISNQTADPPSDGA